MKTVQLARNVQNVLVNGATGVGTSQSAPFNQAHVTTVPDDGVLQVQAIPTGSFSSLTLTLQLSSDGGVTWSQVGNIWDAVAEPVTQMQISGPAVDPTTGLPVEYRLSVTTFVGGTSVIVKGWIAPLGPQFQMNGPTSDVTAFQGGAWAVSITEGGNTAIVTAAGALKVDGSGVTLTTEDLATNIIGNPIVPDAIQIGYEDGSGNTQIPSAANPMPVTVISGGGSPNVNLIEVNSVAVGSPTTWGTPPTGSAVIGVNAELFAGNTGLTTITAGSPPVACLAVHDPASSGTQTVVQGTTPWVDNITEWNSVSLGSPSAQGTLQTSGNIISTNSQIFVGTNAVRTNQTTTAAGVVDVNIVGSLGSTMSATHPLFSEISDGTNAMGAMANYGTSPGAVKAVGVNASLAIGTTQLAAESNYGTAPSAVAAMGVNAFVTNIVEVSPTTSANSKTNPFFTNIADGTNSTALGLMGTAVATSVYTQPVMAGLQASVSGTQTALTGTGTSLNVNVTNASIAVTGTVAVTQSTSPWVVSGGSNIFEVSPTTAANTKTNPFFNEITDGTNVMGAMANFGSTPGAVDALNANASLFIGTVAAATAASGVQLVGIEGRAGTSLETTAGVLDTNLKNIGNSAVSASSAQLGANIFASGSELTANQTTQHESLDVNLVSVLGATMSVTNPIFSAITDGTTKVAVISATSALKTDLSSVAGSATATATTGVQLVGIEGRAGTSLETTAGVLDENIKNYGNSAVVTNGIAGNIPTGNYGTSNTSAAAWTSSTTLNTAVTLVSNISGYSSVSVTLNQAPSGTLTGGVVTFQASNDNANWYNISGVDPNTLVPIGPTYALVVATYSIFMFTLPAPYFRVLLSTAITGTVTVGYAVDTLPTVHNIAGSFTGASIVGGTFNPASNGTTGSGVPADADYLGLNVGGTLRGWTGVNPSGTVYAGQCDVTSIGGTTVSSSTAQLGMNVVQWGGTAVSATTAGIPDINVKNVGNSAVSTAASGVQKVGIVGNAGASMDAALGTAPTNALGTSLFPATTGGCSTAVSQALTTTINVKASAGQLYGYTVSNSNTGTIYLMYYNTATTPGTIGSATNLLLEIGIPAGSAANVSFDNGIAFSSGIAVAVATTATGNTAPGTGLTITSIYK